MGLPLKQAAEGTSKAVGSFREAIQDLLVPELRAVKVTIEGLTQEMRLRTEQLSQEMRLRETNLKEELRLRDAALREELKAYSEEGKLRDAHLREELKAYSEEGKLRDAHLREELKSTADRFAREVQVLAERLDYALDVRERLGALEARLPRSLQ